jgi:hypothetical protein
MRTDALSDLIRDVGDDSPAEHKAIFHLWSALDDIDHDRPHISNLQQRVARAFESAASALERKS